MRGGSELRKGKGDVFDWAGLVVVGMRGGVGEMVRPKRVLGG